jgi:hypothetical protein
VTLVQRRTPNSSYDISFHHKIGEQFLSGGWVGSSIVEPHEDIFTLGDEIGENSFIFEALIVTRPIFNSEVFHNCHPCSMFPAFSAPSIMTLACHRTINGLSLQL